MIEYFDSHTHLQFAAYNKDREDIIEKTLREALGFVNVGTNKKTSKEALELAERYENEAVYATVGLHPIHTYENPEGLEEFDYDFYKKLALKEKVVAIGECGLDYAHFVRENNERLQNGASAEVSNEGGLSYIRTKPAFAKASEDKEKQRKVFEEQIKLSSEIGKPLMIHCREAYKDLIAIIRNSKFMLPKPPGIAHFFAGTKENAEELLELGFYFTFGGVVTLTRDYDEVVKMIPDDKLLLETDAPYVTPMSHRGKRNEPLYIKETYGRVSKLRDVPLPELKKQILKNNEKVFEIKLGI